MMTRSFETHPIAPSFLHNFGRSPQRRDNSSVISTGKVRLSFLITDYNTDGLKAYPLLL